MASTVLVRVRFGQLHFSFLLHTFVCGAGDLELLFNKKRYVLTKPSEVWADATVPGTGATFFIAAGVLAPDTPSCGRGATLTGGEGGAKLLDVTLLPPANVPSRASRLQSCLQSENIKH